MLYESLAAFYAEDEARERSPETDFGVMWTDGPDWPRYRVSWIRDTGEFYAIRLSYLDGVEVLGRTAANDPLAAAEALSGWELRDNNRLEWARRRLRMRDPDYVPTVDEALEPCARCGSRPAIPPSPMCDPCQELGPLSPDEAVRWRVRQAEERESWPVHQPECLDAPIPGRQWYSGCEPGGDYDWESGTYSGTGPRVDPRTGICEGCGGRACRVCGREDCPDHD